MGYNQPSHLGYYLPDATAVQFTVIDNRVIHYVNCIGDKVVGVTAPDGSTSETLPEGETMNQDTRLSHLTFTGQASTQGEWKVTISSIGSSNGMETTYTLTIDLGGADGIRDGVEDCWERIKILGDKDIKR